MPYKLECERLQDVVEELTISLKFAQATLKTIDNRFIDNPTKNAMFAMGWIESKQYHSQLAQQEVYLAKEEKKAEAAAKKKAKEVAEAEETAKRKEEKKTKEVEEVILTPEEQKDKDLLEKRKAYLLSKFSRETDETHNKYLARVLEVEFDCKDVKTWKKAHRNFSFRSHDDRNTLLSKLNILPEINACFDEFIKELK